MQAALLSLELHPELQTRKSFILAIHIARSVNIYLEHTHRRTIFNFVSTDFGEEWNLDRSPHYSQNSLPMG